MVNSHDNMFSKATHKFAHDQGFSYSPFLNFNAFYERKLFDICKLIWDLNQ